MSRRPLAVIAACVLTMGFVSGARAQAPAAKHPIGPERWIGFMDGFVFGFIVVPYLVIAGVLAFLLVYFLRRKAGTPVIETLALAPATVAVVWTTVSILHAIHASRSSTAAIGYLFMPWIAAFMGLVWYWVGWSVMALVRAAKRSFRPEGRTLRTGVEAAIACAILAVCGGFWYAAEVRVGLLAEARSETLSAERAAELCEGASAGWNVTVVEELARNPRTPEPVLRKIFETVIGRDGPRGDRSEGYQVLVYLAANHNTPSDILARLASREEDAVRWGVAANPNTPVSLLDGLSRDGARYVRQSLCMNPNVTREILTRLKTDADPSVSRYAESAWGWRAFSADNAR